MAAAAWVEFWDGRLDLDALAWETSEHLRDITMASEQIARATAQAHPSVFTVPVALSAMVDSESSQSGTGMLLAMSVLSLIPIMLFFAFAQKYLIRGMATTGLKG